jgi:hypothetical protein
MFLSCIRMHLNVFIIYVNIFEFIYNIFMVYFNLSLVYFNAFQCVWKYLNVFINIAIGISPSYSNCNVFAMRTHVHIYFSLSTMTTFLTCYTTTLFSSIPIDSFQLSYNLWKNYISILTFHIYTTPHIPHSMSSLIAWSIAEPK